MGKRAMRFSAANILHEMDKTGDGYWAN
jgi:hypothetical protein